MMRAKPYLHVFAGLLALAVTSWLPALHARVRASRSPDVAVRALFDVTGRGTTPFPSDIFTVPDPVQKTGRRVNLPYPDCSVHVSDCHDLDVINTLDGFGLQPRLSIPFDGAIDPGSVHSSSVFLVGLAAGSPRIGINQVVWDPATLTLHVESDALLAQHSRYALIITNGVRDMSGVAVQPTLDFMTYPSSHSTPHWYKKDLDEAIRAALEAGVRRPDIVAASVFTTLSVTPVMERLRDAVEAGPAPTANFHLGPAGERTAFSLATISSIQWRQQTGVHPSTFATAALDMGVLHVVPGAVDRIAYASFESPHYLVRPDAVLPPVGTLADTPPLRGHEAVYLTVFLPAGIKPPQGWPVAIVAAPAGASRNIGTHLFAAFHAAQGIATIGITSPGTGFGPESTLTVHFSTGGSLTFPEGGRSYDQDGNHVIGAAEGSIAAAPRTWTVGDRDTNRQAAADLVQLVRVIQQGLDVDGEGSRDLDPDRISFAAISGGSLYGTIFAAIEPDVHTVVLRPAGMSPEHGRWAPMRRAGFLGGQLAARIPSLINAPGIAAIDGVAVGAPRFDENKPLRDRPAVTNTVSGAIGIQEAFEMQEWGQQAGQSPILWAPYLRNAPLTGVQPKSVLLQFMTGDQQAVNPANLAFVRAGDLLDAATLYRHDLASAIDPTVPKNPHMAPLSITSPNALFRSIARGLQVQQATFFASGGTTVITPSPEGLFEVPAQGLLPENLNYIR
jgi:hypothetical protein